MKERSMNIRHLAALALLGALASTSAQAAVGSWSYVYNNNGVYVSEYSNTVSASTPPLPLNFAGSRVSMSLTSVSGTGMLAAPWGTLAGAIGLSATVTGISASILPSSTVTTSVTTLTTLNSYHDVGMTVSNTAGQLYKVRVTEIKQ